MQVGMMWIVVTYELVNAIVEDIKQNIISGRFKAALRAKNGAFLRKIGWTYNSMFQFLLDNLCADDYIKGPENDHNGSQGSVWIFEKKIIVENFCYDVYIKLKNVTLKNGTTTYCLSFHEAEHKLKYYFKEELA